MTSVSQGEKIKTVFIGSSSFGHSGGVLGEPPGAESALDMVAMAPVLSNDLPEKMKDKFPFCSEAEVYDDYKEMLAKTSPELAVISTRIDRIGEAAYEAAKYGCHTICEKPIAVDREKLLKHYNLLGKEGLYCIAMVHNGSNPVFDAAKKLVSAGKLGEIALCNARKSYKFGNRPEWFGKRETYGGTIPWVGIHALDFMNIVTGLHFTRVHAMQSNLLHKKWPDCEDNCVVNMELSNGGHASISIDYMRPESAETHGDAWLRVVGGKGVLEASLKRDKCVFVGDGEPEHDITLGDYKPFYAPLFKALAEGDKARLAYLTARSFMLNDAALAARDSADNGESCFIGGQPWHDVVA